MKSGSMHHPGSTPPPPAPPHRTPHLVQATSDFDPATALSVSDGPLPPPTTTLGEIGIATHVAGAEVFPPTILIQPIDLTSPTGVDPATLRVFLWDEDEGGFQPIWRSGVNLSEGLIWSKIRHPGVYVPIGLPSDPLLRELVSVLARERRYVDVRSPDDMKALTDGLVEAFLAIPQREFDELRRVLVETEIQTGDVRHVHRQRRLGRGARLGPHPLPGGDDFSALARRLRDLDISSRTLPEEHLLYGPETRAEIDPRMHADPTGALDRHERLEEWLERFPFPFLPCWFRSRNWWMYHHDDAHTGRASGCSPIRSTTAGCLLLRHTVSVDGPVAAIPSIVNGKVYFGTGNSSSAASHSGGSLYRVDLASGVVEAQFTFDTPPGAGSGQGYAGIASSPAIVGGRVFTSGLDGKLYCLDATTLAVIWVTDLRHADPAKNQPVQHAVNANGWSSPLVVNGNVYVGFGEGEQGAFGFVYCLDASSGCVNWLFCTNQFVPGTDNGPNMIPASAVGISPLPAPFSSHPDPVDTGGNPVRGASVWSSAAYDRSLNRVYVGTGNTSAEDATPLPDTYYGCGVLALNADDGGFRGFFQPDPTDSYRPDDTDVDIPAAPLLFTAGSQRTLAIGSKNGSFFLLDPATMTVRARRQLLPYDSAGNRFPNVDPGPGENMFGVFGCAAPHHGLHRLFVGLGGYGGMIDTPTTPFARAMDWETLADVWATGGNDPPRYTASVPPMYTTPGEAGLSSPAVVNDVVFLATSKPGLYAMDAETGLHLWSAPGLGAGDYILGAAVYGRWVVAGVSNGPSAGRVCMYAL